MNRDEYLKTVSDQISTPCIRDAIRRELAAHVEDQKEAFMENGMAEGDAETAAVQDMGDPVEVGLALDELHKPKPARKYVAAFMILNSFLVGMNIYYIIFDEKIRLASGTVAALLMAETVFLLFYFCFGFYRSEKESLSKSFLTVGNAGMIICLQVLLPKFLFSRTGLCFSDTYMFSMMTLLILGYQGVLFYCRRKKGGWWKSQIVGLTGLLLSVLASENVWFIGEGALIYALVYTRLFNRRWFDSVKKRILISVWTPFGICAGILIFRFYEGVYGGTMHMADKIAAFQRSSSPVDNSLNFNFLTDITGNTGPAPVYILLILGILFVILLISYCKHLTNEWSRLIYFTSILILTAMILNGSLTVLGFFGREMAFAPFMWNLTWNYQEGITLDYGQILTYYAIAGYLTRFTVRDSTVSLEIESEKIQAERGKCEKKAAEKL